MNQKNHFKFQDKNYHYMNELKEEHYFLNLYY